MAKTLTGQVVSAKTPKTVVVAVQERRRHKLYDKQYLVTTRLKVHDETSRAKLGDKVRIAAVRPISKHKSWVLEAVVEAARGGEKPA